MTRKLVPLLLVALLAPAASAAAQDVPSERVLYQDGHTNRYLVDGQWLFRLDPGYEGLASGFMRDTGTEGWTPTTVPNAWNAGDETPESMKGTIGWYRKDFRLPSSSRRYDWILRFESVNYRTRAWLNGRPIGQNRGAYLPFELRIPSNVLRRGGVNRLVVRVDNVRRSFDLPPAGLSRTAVPTGGWWNYGGILREVYLRRVERVAINTVQVLPQLPCRTCAATVNARITVRNLTDRTQTVSASGRFGAQRFRLGSRRVPARGFATFTDGIRVGGPRLWSPESPSLYSTSFSISAGGRPVAGYRARSGIRSITVVGGRLHLNGLPVNVRGVGMHEDDRAAGFALTPEMRESIFRDAKELGSTMIRSHYPLHPHFHELADAQGMLVWSEIPMYGMKTEKIKNVVVRKVAANELRDNVLSNGTHPSIVIWSVGNELSSRPGPVQGDYMRRAAEQARNLDPTRAIGYAVAGYPSAGCHTEYAPLDVIGINDYFGWYPGPSGQLADRTFLSEYLDAVRACYADKAIMITETGAEANRDGPVEEKGTYQFQQEYINYHYGVYATKPWLSGALYWALKEFRVRPEWEGGNPRPNPPLHQKGVVAYDGTRKPAYADLQRIFTQTDQYPGR
ncbi:MAG TPA: glycoside hydrolase family 2 TIM barrel-domain containing protein [Solirubrobacteraceae bacterium]|nr:glycoside hydrolase family 2 TIM barrel-domain containing protein [Solirubrobacteraceae bacterium]